MTFVCQIGAIVRLDLLDFWRTRWVVAGFFSLNLADLIILLPVLDRVIPFDYMRFALPGIAASAASWAALDQSRKVFWELQARTHYYLRTLPFQQTALVVARLVGAAIKGLTYSLWLLVTALIIGSLGIEHSFIALGAILMISLSMGAVGVAIGAVTREFGAWSTMNALFSLALTTLSTAFYPLDAITKVNPALGVVAVWNPISGVADLLRWSPHVDLMASAIRLLLVTLALIISGGVLYQRVLTGEYDA